MKLNEAAQINSISDEYIMLMDANGNPLKIAKTDLANALASFVPAIKGEVWIVYLDSDMHSERFDAYCIRSLQHHGTENAQRLGCFIKTYLIIISSLLILRSQ